MIIMTKLTLTIPPIESTKEFTSNLMLGFLEINLNGLSTLTNLDYKIT